jgi:hypothetical protein
MERDNTVEPKNGEKLSTYLHRHCHRDESDKTALRYATAQECTIGKKGKKRRKPKSVSAKLENRLEEDSKWHEEGNNEGNVTTEQGGKSATTNVNNEFTDGYLLMNEDADVEEVVSFANQVLADTVGDTTTHNSNNGGTNKDKRYEVRLIRELGIGTTVSISDDCVMCNCEIFNRWKTCRHCIWFEFLHYGATPPSSAATDGNNSYTTSMREKFWNT